MTEPQGWQPVDPSNPPATHMVAIYNDGSGAQCLSKFDDDDNYYLAEDGFAIPASDLSRDYSWWTPAPEGFVPHFMEVTQEDWR